MKNDGWELVLANYLREASGLSFVWGENDCALWASTFVDLITGSTHADEWRGLYDTEEGALALMQERGFADCAAIADSHLEETPIELAQRGSIVLHPSGALGICDGRRSFFLLQDRGITAFPTLSCPKAWVV